MPLFTLLLVSLVISTVFIAAFLSRISIISSLQARLRCSLCFSRLVRPNLLQVRFKTGTISNSPKLGTLVIGEEGAVFEVFFITLFLAEVLIEAEKEEIEVGDSGS